MREPDEYRIEAAKHLKLAGTPLELTDVKVKGVQGPKAIRACSEHIRKRYAELSEPRKVPLSPYEREAGYLRRATYAFTKFVEEEGGLAALEDVVIGQNKGWTSSKGPNISDNPFHWMLAAVFPDNTLKKTKEDKSAPMFPQQRSHIARQLLYADRHNVPTEHLIGLLYQSGKPGEITKKLKENTYESWADPVRMADVNKHKRRGAAAFRIRPKKAQAS